MGRFINADGFTSTGQGNLGNNMYAYCLNCPVIFSDDVGMRARTVVAVCVNDGGYCTPERDYKDPYETVSDNSIDIYIVPAGEGKAMADEIGNKGDAFVIEDMRNNKDNPNIKIHYSSLVTDPALQREILELIVSYNAAYPSEYEWSREVDEMLYEWDYHNALANMGFAVDRTGHVDLDMKDKNKSVFQKGWEFITG